MQIIPFSGLKGQAQLKMLPISNWYWVLATLYIGNIEQDSKALEFEDGGVVLAIENDLDAVCGEVAA